MKSNTRDSTNDFQFDLAKNKRPIGKGASGKRKPAAAYKRPGKQARKSGKR